MSKTKSKPENAPQEETGGDCVSHLVQRLREACNGHPAAKIPWPHRILHEAAEEIEILRTALADAIRRPMGVIPASAEGHITDEEIRRAEESRVKFKPDGERIHSLHNVKEHLPPRSGSKNKQDASGG